MNVISQFHPHLHNSIEQQEENNEADQTAGYCRNRRSLYTQRRQTEMTEDQQIVAGYVNKIHQQGDHHCLFGETVGPYGRSQGIDQRLQENPASDNMNINLGMYENIPCYIQRSQQCFPEDQHGCTKNNAYSQIECNSIARDLRRLLRLLRSEILRNDNGRPVADHAEHEYSHSNNLIGRTHAGHRIIRHRADHERIHTSHKHEQKQLQKNRPGQLNQIKLLVFRLVHYTPLFVISCSFNLQTRCMLAQLS
ncbi:hypothetical protein D3C75_738370 [compost metagenome]